MADIAVSREEAVWLTTSASQNTDVTTFATANTVYHTGTADMTQQINLIDNMEKRNSRTRLKPIAERYPPGAWSFPTYFKPASNANTAPETDVLWLSAFGVKTSMANTHVTATNGATNTASLITVTTATTAVKNNTPVLVKKGTTGDEYEVAWVISHTSSAKCTSGSLIRISPELGTAPATGVSLIGGVAYSQIATSPISFGMLKSVGHSVFRYRGCVVQEVQANVNGDGIAELAWSGEYMREYRTGTDALACNLTSSATTMIVAGSPFRFMNGSMLMIGSEAIGVTQDPASNATATVRGLSRGIKSTTKTTHGSALDVTPWKPSSLGTSRGSKEPGYKGYLELNGTKLVILNSTVTYSPNTKMAVGEKNNSKYVTSFSNPSFADVAGSLTAYFRTANIKHFRDAQDQIDQEIVVPVGDPKEGAGKLASIQMRQSNLKTPALTGDEEVTEALDLTAFGAPASDLDAIRVGFL